MVSGYAVRAFVPFVAVAGVLGPSLAHVRLARRGAPARNPVSEA
jgi:hypothetical protein